jgi:hypothetical protein
MKLKKFIFLRPTDQFWLRTPVLHIQFYFIIFLIIKTHFYQRGVRHFAAQCPRGARFEQGMNKIRRLLFKGKLLKN